MSAEPPAAQIPRWTYCTCEGPAPEAVAYLFIAAHLARDPGEAIRLAGLVDDAHLQDLELILRRAAAETRQRLARRHPGFDGGYDDQDIWFVLDQMTGHRVRDQHISAHLERIEAGLPPAGVDDRTGWIEVLHTEAALITSYYYAVSDDTDTAQHQLRTEAHRLIGHQLPTEPQQA